MKIPNDINNYNPSTRNVVRNVVLNPTHIITHIITHMHTHRMVVLPKQWYAQRARSESHTSSDMEQYQDASDCLTLEMNALALSPSSQVIVTTSTTEYLELDTGHALSYASTDYLDLDSGRTHGHASSDYLDSGHTRGHTSSEYLELGPASTEHLDLGPDNHDSIPLLPMDVFTDATGEPIIVANDIEVSCDEVDESGVVVEDD